LVTGDLSSSGAISAKDASDNIPTAALANSSAQTAKCNANLNEKNAICSMKFESKFE
jgi:hypothetical protein